MKKHNKTKLENKHDDICRMCGSCCFIDLKLKQDGINFIPISHVAPNFVEEDRQIYGYYVCEHFDIKTRECKIYDKRPDKCKKFFCKGNPRPMTVMVEGKSV